jgi:hypothetical protein
VGELVAVLALVVVVLRAALRPGGVLGDARGQAEGGALGVQVADVARGVLRLSGRDEAGQRERRQREDVA